MLCTLLFLFFNLFSPTIKNDKYVNMFMGSAGDHGQVTPAAAVPFGMVSICPDSSPNQHGGYDYNVDVTSGVSINRISGVGCNGTGGNLRIKPSPFNEELRIVKGTEKAVPGYYETLFSNGVKGMFTAKQNMAVEKYVFPKSADKILCIDFNSSFEQRVKVISKYKVSDNNTISGCIISPTACRCGTYTMYFQLKSNVDFKLINSNDSIAAIIYPQDTDEVEIRISVSSVDDKEAADILENWEDDSFKKIKESALKEWRKKLDLIEVKGSSKENKILFYTSLYRLFLSPMNTSSLDGKYRGTDGKIYQDNTFKYYSSWSMWDSFRTKFPLYAIIQPTEMTDICKSAADLFRTGKKNWATYNESVPTVRTEHTGIMLLDAYRKGIKNIDFSTALDGMKLEAKKNLPRKKPDQRLETSYDLWAISQIASIIGNKEDAEAYQKESYDLFYDTWTKYFMNITPEFKKMKNNGLYQGSRWQYRWAAPQYLDEMIKLTSKEKLCEELKEFFDDNLFNQGNEPDIHTPFIFNRLGHPEQSSSIIHKLINDDKMIHKYGGNAEYPTPYIGKAFKNTLDGYAPEMDEDDGTMSAWYIFCSIGIYPLIVGTDKYELTSPIFDSVKIKSGNNILNIKTKGRKKDSDTIKCIKLNDNEIKDYSVSHDIFKSSNTLTFYY